MYGKQEPSSPQGYGGTNPNYDQYSSQQPTTGIPMFGNNNPYDNNNNAAGNYPPPPPPPQQGGGFGGGWGSPNVNQAQPGITCTSTSNSLEHHLRESNHGENTAIFNCYFMPHMMPPRCIACQRLIAEHPAQASNTTSAYSSGGAGLLLGGGGVERPTFTQEGGRDVYVNSGLIVFRIVGSILLLVGIVLFVVFGSKFDPEQIAGGTVFIAPCILTFIGCIFTAITKRVTLTFDKDLRRCSYHLSRFPWICFNKATTVLFSDITGVSANMNNVRINNMPQADIIMHVRGGQGNIDLGMTSMFDANGKAEGWKVYLRELGCPIE